MNASPATLNLLIDGEWVTGAGPEIASTNPAHLSELIASGPGASPDDLESAIVAAHRASAAWARMPHQSRAQIMRRAANLLRERALDLGAELTREEGKTLVEGIGEVQRAADVLEFHASVATAPSGETYASPRPDETIIVQRRPLGVVGVVTPFNFPIAIPAWKISPALTYGNTVVWKPASTVPLLAQRFAEALQDAGLPQGVLNLVPGSSVIGERLVAHPLVDAVTFTGSTGVGRSLISTCGALAKPIQAEMGGNNVAIVFADADLELAATEVVNGAFRGTGQRCTATSRLLVEGSISGDFLGEVAKRTDAIEVGDPLDQLVGMGPVVSEGARADVAAATSRARDSATMLSTRSEADLPDEGYFVAPSLFALPAHDHELWTREVFGPVVGALQFETLEEAISLANDTEFGLSASVFAADLGVTLRMLDDLEVGVLHVNSETGGADPHVPFGGSKSSGFGPKEQGFAAREFFTTHRTAYVRGA